MRLMDVFHVEDDHALEAMLEVLTRRNQTVTNFVVTFTTFSQSSDSEHLNVLRYVCTYVYTDLSFDQNTPYRMYITSGKRCIIRVLLQGSR